MDANSNVILWNHHAKAKSTNSKIPAVAEVWFWVALELLVGEFEEFSCCPSTAALVGWHVAYWARKKQATIRSASKYEQERIQIKQKLKITRNYKKAVFFANVICRALYLTVLSYPFRNNARATRAEKMHIGEGSSHINVGRMIWCRCGIEFTKILI